MLKFWIPKKSRNYDDPAANDFTVTAADSVPINQYVGWYFLQQGNIYICIYDMNMSAQAMI